MNTGTNSTFLYSGKKKQSPFITIDTKQLIIYIYKKNRKLKISVQSIIFNWWYLYHDLLPFYPAVKYEYVVLYIMPTTQFLKQKYFIILKITSVILVIND